MMAKTAWIYVREFATDLSSMQHSFHPKCVPILCFSTPPRRAVVVLWEVHGMIHVNPAQLHTVCNINKSVVTNLA